MLKPTDKSVKLTVIVIQSSDLKSWINYNLTNIVCWGQCMFISGWWKFIGIGLCSQWKWSLTDSGEINVENKHKFRHKMFNYNV